LAPHDALVIKHEVLWLLWSIEWDCHHLPQALLATPDAVLRQLRELEDRLSLLPEDRRAHASEQMRYLREILQAYLDGRKGKAATRT